MTGQEPLPGPETPTTRLQRRRGLRTVLSVLVVLATFYFMGRGLARNWHEVEAHFAGLVFRWWFLIPSLAAFVLSFLVVAFAWPRILSCFGERLRLRDSIRIVAYSTLGKYLPGKVWAVLGRVYLARECGVAGRHSAASVVVETAYLLLAALCLFSVTLPFYATLPWWTWLLLLLIPVTLVLVYPPIFNRLVNFLLARVKQPGVDLRLGIGRALGLFGLYVLSWVAVGVGLYFLTRSFAEPATRAALVFPGAFALSWIIGFLVIWAPGGLGVREGLFAVMLNPVVSGAMNIVISLTSRIWFTLFELLAALVVFLCRNWGQTPNPEIEPRRTRNTNQ